MTNKYPMISMEGTGRNIRALLEQHGMSVKDLVEILNVSEQAIYKWERGITLPSTDNQVILAYLFHTSIEGGILDIIPGQDDLSRDDVRCGEYCIYEFAIKAYDFAKFCYS